MNRKHIGRRHIRLDSTDSTNNRAAEFADDPAFAGTVVTASVQSQGRGQHGRTWQSRPGTSVLLSTLLFPPTELRRPAVLTAFAAVAVCETIQNLIACKTTIKWPNDVYLNGKKVCGILTECGVHNGSTPHFVVGIGLNVGQSVDDLLAMELPGATSLSIAAGLQINTNEVEDRLIDGLDALYGQLINNRLGDLQERWVQHLEVLDVNVTVERMDATEVCGRLTSLTFDQAVIELGNGTAFRLRPEEIRHLRR